LVNKSEYGLLYNVIGGTFGETSTQFRLPDPRGRVIGAVGSGSGLTTRSKGDEVGEETHQLTIPEMPSHNHTGTTSSNATGITTNAAGGANPGLAYRSGNNTATTLDPTSTELDLVNTTALVITDPTHAHTFTTSNTGGDQPHNNMQPTLFYGNMFIYCGKVNNGSFPYKTGTDLL
jgi:microcystin-dependent protein